MTTGARSTLCLRRMAVCGRIEQIHRMERLHMNRQVGALCLALCLLLGAGCAASPEDTNSEYSEYLMAMDTLMTLTAYGPQAEEGVTQARAVITALEGLLSVTDEDSEVWAINHSGGASVTVQADTAALLDLSLDLAQKTGGALDPTIYPVLRAWGFTTDQKRVPGAEELAGLLERVDYTAVEWDGETITLPDGMELDFGSVAKGYAGQKAAEALRAAGVTSALLDLGGNIQTVGSHDGQPWRIGITDPEDPQSYLGVVTVEDEAVVTSGGYQRYFEENGVRYWHILDPSTGQPARSGLSSVTIIGSDGGLCDGLSTALFVLGLEGAADYWRQWGGFEAVLITDEGQVWITEGLEDRFTLTGTYAEGTVEVLRQGD